MQIINADAEQYAEKYTSAEDELLKEIAEYTYSKHPKSHMLSGHVQGKFLEMISCMMKPERILEIGTFTGYSALCLAKGLTAQGRLYTIEMRDDDADTAQLFFSKSLNRDKIYLHRGNALDIIPDLDHEWDIVFIDADKTGYIDYYEVTLPKLRRGGIIIADNVLFHGEVLNNPVRGKNAEAIDAFNKHVALDNRTEEVMITLRDGVSLIRKL